MKRVDKVLQSSDVVAVLKRDVVVRLLDISGSGCLLRSDSPLAEGTTGCLRVTVDDGEYEDDVRIIRCRRNAGSAGYQLGAEFLWTTTPGERSLRRVVASLQASAVKASRLQRNTPV